MTRPTRRELLHLAAAALPAAAAAPSAPSEPTPCVFSKHLAWLDYPDMGRALRRMGASAVDLTVRPGGQVLPENVERDLPRAHAALAAEGVSIPMITTGLTSLDDPAARPTVYTAAELKIPFFKLGYYRLRDAARLRETLDETKPRVDGMAALAAHAGVQGGFHNHSGGYVGAAVWDAWELIEDLDPQALGVYFDPCHATIEGGLKGWEINFRLVAPRLKMIACKDFYWEKRAGEWRVVMCPLGEGMVDYERFFPILREIGFNGPISLHAEYEIAGATEAAVRENTLAALERDFSRLKEMWSRSAA